MESQGSVPFWKLANLLTILYPMKAMKRAIASHMQIQESNFQSPQYFFNKV